MRRIPRIVLSVMVFVLAIAAPTLTLKFFGMLWAALMTVIVLFVFWGLDRIDSRQRRR